jgi:transposase
VLTVDDYGAIRRARRDGMSIRQIARTFHHTRRKIRQVLADPEPRPYTRTNDRPAPVLGPFHPVIDQILIDDEAAPPKQRHTAAQVFRRLRDEHDYAGGYAQVQRYLRRHRVQYQETFIPLGHLPGRRLEADFGHIHVDFPDGRRPVSFLVTTWAYSNAPFVMALPFERTEAILEGMVAAFDFFGCVPGEVWWDNPRTVATSILQGRERRLHPRYAALAAHYAFDPHFCMPARGNEKPDAESIVKAVQRRFATPVPRAAGLDELNTFFRKCCEAERDRTVQSLFGPFVIKDRFAEDRAVAGDLPPHRFDPCVIHQAVAVDKYQTVAYDTNRYSVPRAFAFQTVTVKGYVDRVVIVSRGQAVARHVRSHRRHTMVLDPLHYLATLDRKPGALDHAPVFRDWELPACFAAFRAALEREHGATAGGRRYARVLQLLVEHPLARVREAIEFCTQSDQVGAESVARWVQVLAAIATPAAVAEPFPGAAAPSRIHVPLPDLNRFDQLLGGHETQDTENDDIATKSNVDQSTEIPVSVFFA